MSDRCTSVAVHVDGELCHCYYDAGHGENFGHDCGHPEHRRWYDLRAALDPQETP